MMQLVSVNFFRSVFSFFGGNSSSASTDVSSSVDSSSVSDAVPDREAFSMYDIPERHRSVFLEGYKGGPSPLDHLMPDDYESSSE